MINMERERYLTTVPDSVVMTRDYFAGLIKRFHHHRNISFGFSHKHTQDIKRYRERQNLTGESTIPGNLYSIPVEWNTSVTYVKQRSFTCSLVSFYLWGRVLYDLIPELIPIRLFYKPVYLFLRIVRNVYTGFCCICIHSSVHSFLAMTACTSPLYLYSQSCSFKKSTMCCNSKARFD